MAYAVNTQPMDRCAAAIWLYTFWRGHRQNGTQFNVNTQRSLDHRDIETDRKREILCCFPPKVKIPPAVLWGRIAFAQVQ